MTLDKDKLNSTHPEMVILTAFKIIEVLQQQPAEVQIGAVHLLVKILSDKFGLDLSESMARINNLMRDIHKDRPELARAISMYIEKELR